jgi:hypothetical protein
MDKRNQYVPPTEENLERAFKADPPISNQPPEDEVKARLALKVSDPEVAERLRAEGSSGDRWTSVANGNVVV